MVSGIHDINKDSIKLFRVILQRVGNTGLALARWVCLWMLCNLYKPSGA